MSTYIPGATQSEAHARAARNLSEVLRQQRELALKIAAAPTDQKAFYVEDAKNIAVAVKAAREVLRKAYLEYTNPFGVKKTV